MQKTVLENKNISQNEQNTALQGNKTAGKRKRKTKKKKKRKEKEKENIGTNKCLHRKKHHPLYCKATDSQSQAGEQLASIGNIT